MKRNILFVDDEPRVLSGLRRMLYSMRQEWEMAFAGSGPEALKLMAAKPFDVIVSDVRMQLMDGAELLDEVARRYPDTVRIVLSGQTNRELILRTVGPSHQYLAKPCDPERLKETVAKACGLRDFLTRDRLAFVARMKHLPSSPQVFRDILEELKAPEPSMVKIAETIEQDVGLAAKVLQLVNSAYFGRPLEISDPATAVYYLGMETIRSVVLFAGITTMAEGEVNLPGFSIGKLWEHSISVARGAKSILESEQTSGQEVNDAFTAGLLHDCGKLALAVNVPDQYREVLRRARQEERALHQVETEVFSASHAEVGAYLLGLWGLPESIVGTVALHHAARKDLAPEPLVLAAVHVANSLRPQGGTAAGNELARLDRDFLKSLGVTRRLESWLEKAGSTRQPEGVGSPE